MSTTEMSVIQQRCWNFIQSTRYKNNTVYSEDETIESAYAKAQEGQDAGYNGMTQIMPTSTNFTEWLNFLFLCYYLYVRNI